MSIKKAKKLIKKKKEFLIMGYVCPIFYHKINIFHVKGMKKKRWIIYPTTYAILCLVEYRI